MFALSATGAAIALVTGYIIKFAVDRLGSEYRITRTEFIAGSLLVTLIVCPLTAVVGSKVAVAANSKFNEYWNGWESAALVDVIACTRDGSCKHTYDCDPYTVLETYYVTDADGDRHLRTRTVTKWHSCPVGTEEATYKVTTTVGDFVLSKNQFTPQTREWGKKGLGNVATTPPAQWVAVRDRVAAGRPGPATSVHTYDNWILASQYTVLDRYSDAIDRYAEAGLLPASAQGTHSYYLADKAYFVGHGPTDAGAWQDAVGRVGAALGTDKQGDLHVVLVDRADVDPDEYVSALMASWQDPARKRDALAKNAVVLVAGTNDAKTVAWARVATGMPGGNAALQVAARTELTGTPWTPEALVGTPAGPGDTPGAGPRTPGALEELLWDDVTGFARVCMTCDDPEDAGGVGYDYLRAQMEPTAGQYVAIGSVMVALSGLLWAGFAAYTHTPVGRSTFRRN